MQVCTVVDNGGFAEQLAVNQAAVIKLPDNVDMAAAAGLPVAFGTAYMALVERAKVKKGQTVLVLGAGGGVGTAAVQVRHMCSMYGLHEVVSSSSTGCCADMIALQHGMPVCW